MSKLNKWIMYLIVLFQTNFFLMQNKLFISSTFNTYNSQYIILFLVMLLVIINVGKIYSHYRSNLLTYKVPIIIFFLVIIVVSIWTNHHYGQSLFSTFTATYYFYIPILYFYLVILADNDKDLWNLSRFYINIGGIYSLIIIVQNILLRGNIVFLNLDPTSTRVDYNTVFMGFYRMPMPADFISFSVLILLIVAYRKSSINVFRMIILAIDMFYIVFISQTRIYILLDFLLILIFIFMKLNKINRIFSIILGYIIGALVVFNVSRFILSFTTGARQLSYTVRLEAIKYYFTEMKQTPVFGIGLPNTFDTTYILHGNVLNTLGYQYFLDDIGILGFVFNFGILGIISLIAFIIRVLKDFINSKEKLYILLPISYLIVTSISVSLFNVQRIVYLPFVLFWISYLSQKED